MKHAHLMFLLAIALASCNQQKKSPETTTGLDTTSGGEMKIMIPSSTCYSGEIGKDSVLLKVEIFPNVVTGKISYKFHEKDSNSGEFDGHLTGDTLLADYKFMSEGKLSERQVIFLVKDGVATEGYGEMVEKDEKIVFKDISQVSFGKGFILRKTGCGEY